MNASEKLDKATGLAVAVQKLGTTTIVLLVGGALFGLMMWLHYTAQRDDILERRRASQADVAERKRSSDAMLAEQKVAHERFISAFETSNRHDEQLNAGIEERNKLLKENNELIRRVATALERMGGLEE